MTIQQALELCDEQRPNAYPITQKLRWLSELDGTVYTELISTHAPDADTPSGFRGYEGADQTTELLVPYPFADELYTSFLSARLDRKNGEIDAYNRSAAQFNAAYQAYADYYNRTHAPRSAGGIRF